jgi:hypothetical protein
MEMMRKPVKENANAVREITEISWKIRRGNGVKVKILAFRWFGPIKR